VPSFAHTQAATDGERDVHLVYYAFDLLHLDDWDVSNLQLPSPLSQPAPQRSTHLGREVQLRIWRFGSLALAQLRRA
jgi:hypothetical protein